ncbi:uncharacterized protein YcbK (DUF882 family) [Parabacteroides sp. PF5-5]|uniref:D-Ala-D-Ala carboxypeptidase family metallohydrolase n=1 Tax=unclassified Parabacteroides TaxID=2649774 RepID=UPI0024733E6B|nr:MULTISPECIES: D-Ala-D-Ala carboxypeptidase family metallohydrolase [unclassified Parabacteroides]MDH6304499.1 uncharacterized protein YcbK (DUF882 family) [Parabacteroides sp. PH5-39]MDH6315348.1 uncharacterized protein YcbK (DUF882 family) [Parabacteroides sp. PF5-13]MDH6319158.1 uncharacterized protein YcbK (DUF882 family) [Parabacteroides sp. PH5-13]MDH6322888.1 uncharacterized protein YcbK (DUF882 family) [Parabacteroides sp. PH5-8]MDH6326540.1 uncharacterized protein YcbK (DUF882 famil
MNITKDFTWEEMLYSHTAGMHNIINQPGKEERIAIEELVKRLLQPLRLAYGKPIRITSGYRCAQLNKRVGGVPSSQHVKGQAADCVIKGSASVLLGVLLVHKLPFDQAILYKKQNFLHLSLHPYNNRYQILFK